MAMLPAAFQADDHEDMGSFEPIPAADYNVKVVESEMCLTKKAQEADNPALGQYLKLKMEVMDGKFKGRTLFRNLNLVNSSAQAVEIAQKELASICKAVGLVTIQDSGELHDKPMQAKVVVKPGDANYGPKNEVKNYKAYEGPSEEASPEASSAPAATGVKKKKAWE